MTDGSHITRLGGVKQEIQDLKSGLESSINEVKVIIDGKFSEINSQLRDIKESLASTINDIVTKSILKVKDSIIEALKEENIKLQIKKKNVKTLKLGYLIREKLQKDRTSTLGGIILKCMAYQ